MRMCIHVQGMPTLHKLEGDGRGLVMGMGGA